MSSRLVQKDPSFRPAGRIGVGAILFLLVLLSVPAYALVQLRTWIDWRLIVGVPVVISAVTFYLYRRDKLRAQLGEWRVPESTLHLWELLGGWPGAFLAQRRFRHKTTKRSYQIAFWLIVLTHQFIALDSLARWRFTNELFRFVSSRFS